MVVAVEAAGVALNAVHDGHTFRLGGTGADLPNGLVEIVSAVSEVSCENWENRTKLDTERRVLGCPSRNQETCDG